MNTILNKSGDTSSVLSNSTILNNFNSSYRRRQSRSNSLDYLEDYPLPKSSSKGNSRRSSTEKSLDDLSSSNKRRINEVSGHEAGTHQINGKIIQEDLIPISPTKAVRKYTNAAEYSQVGKENTESTNITNESDQRTKTNLDYDNRRTHPAGMDLMQISTTGVPPNLGAVGMSKQNTLTSIGPESPIRAGHLAKVSSLTTPTTSSETSDPIRYPSYSHDYYKSSHQNLVDLDAIPKLQKNFNIPPEVRKTKRFMIIDEIYNVEKQYANNLSFIIKEFKIPLEEQNKAARFSSNYLSGENDNMFYSHNSTQYNIGSAGGPNAVHHGGNNLDYDDDAASISAGVLPSGMPVNHHLPLEDTAILPAADVKTIFGQIDKIYKIHLGLSIDLNQFLANWDSNNSVGLVMEPYIKMFEKVYPPYVNFYEDIKTNLDNCLEKYPKFEAHAKLAESKRSDRCKITDIMVQPVQRLMRYPLMFQRLKAVTQKECSINHPDNKHLEVMTKLLEDVCSHLVVRGGLKYFRNKDTTFFSI